MNKYQLKFLTNLFLISFLILGCSSTEESVEEIKAGNTVTITNFSGIDFTGDGSPDGYLQKYQPNNGSSTVYPNNDNYVWWVPYHDLDNMTRDMGNVDLSTVTQVPSSWEATPNITPLIVGHVYVVELVGVHRLGYAKFKVLAIDLSSADFNYKAEVEYVFSETTTFSE